MNLVYTNLLYKPRYSLNEASTSCKYPVPRAELSSSSHYRLSAEVDTKRLIQDPYKKRAAKIGLYSQKIMHKGKAH